MLYKTLIRTIKQHFANVFVFAVNPDIKKARTNLVLFVFKQQKVNRVQARRKAKKFQIEEMYYNKVAFIDDEYAKKFVDHPILTDEYAPVEYMVAE